jgi:hypothetical protein
MQMYLTLMLILVSIRDSNAIILKIWIKSSLNQETETESDKLN